MTTTIADPEKDIVSFDAIVSNCPEKDDWKAFGTEANAAYASADTGTVAVRLSVMLHNLMQKTANRLGDKYLRKNFIRLADSVLRAFDVPSSINANQLVPLVWVVKLDQSTPSTEEGKPRSWTGDVSNASWYGGNISLRSLRALAGLMARRSEKTSMDEWDYKEGWEAIARDYVKALRACSLSARGMEILIDQRLTAIQAEKARADQSAQTPDQVKNSQEADALAEHNAKLAKLGTELVNTYRDAVKDLKMNKDAFSCLLRDKGIVNPAAIAIATTPARMNAADYAVDMTPGDAKAMVESIIANLVRDPIRYMAVLKAFVAVLKAFRKTEFDAVKKIEDSASDKTTIPMAKTG